MKIDPSSKIEDLNPDQQRYLQEIADLKSRNVSMASQLKFWRREADNMKSVVDTVYKLREYTDQHIIEPKELTGTSETHIILMTGDWHLEEKVYPEKVNRLNEYNLKIAEKRLTNLWRKYLILKDMWSSLTKIDTMTLAVMGDLITGYIHEDLIESNELPPLEALLFAKKQFKAGLRYLLDHGNFKKIDVVCLHGNHGRTTQKKRIKMAKENSFEHFLYQDLQLDYVDEPRVQFRIADGFFSYSNIFGNKFRMHHGDLIRYNGGVGGVTIPANTKIREWDIANPVNVDLFMHIHQSFETAKFITAGSVIGWNEFAEAIGARFEPPMQRMVCVEKKQGITAALKIFVKGEA